MGPLSLLLAVVLATPAEANSGWLASHKFGEHVAEGYVGYLSDDQPQRPGALWVVIQKSGDDSLSVTVGASGCAYQGGQVLSGRRWHIASARRRVGLARSALLSAIADVAPKCLAASGSLSRQYRTFDRKFAVFDRVMTEAVGKR